MKPGEIRQMVREEIRKQLKEEKAAGAGSPGTATDAGEDNEDVAG